MTGFCSRKTESMSGRNSTSLKRRRQHAFHSLGKKQSHGRRRRGGIWDFYDALADAEDTRVDVPGKRGANAGTFDACEAEAPAAKAEAAARIKMEPR